MLIGGGILVAVVVVGVALYFAALRFLDREPLSQRDMEMGNISPTTPGRAEMASLLGSGGEEVTHFQTPIPISRDLTEAGGGDDGEAGTSHAVAGAPSLGRGKRVKKPNRNIFNKHFHAKNN